MAKTTTDNQDSIKPAVRRSGRPRKVPETASEEIKKLAEQPIEQQSTESSVSNEHQSVSQKPKATESVTETNDGEPVVVKRGRGRPPKNKKTQPVTADKFSYIAPRKSCVPFATKVQKRVKSVEDKPALVVSEVVSEVSLKSAEDAGEGSGSSTENEE